MPCPWYKNGLCNSPVLGTPSADPVVRSRCLADENVYVRCRFYREPKGRGAEDALTKKFIQFGKPLLLINSLEEPVSSNCEFFVLEKHESGSYIGGCKALKRYLTRYEVSLCVKNWQDCPYRKIGLKIRKL